MRWGFRARRFERRSSSSQATATSTTSPGAASRVRGFDRQRALEVFEVIGPLDGQAAFLACPQLTEQDLAQMQFLVGSMDLAISSGLILKYDDLQREFHYSYVQKCGNQRLMDLMTQLERCFIKARLQHPLTEK